MREIFLLTDSRVRRAIQEVYKGECQYCGAKGANHIDHIIARSKGGKDALSNYILACRRCNQRKGKGDIAPQFLALITAIADKNEDRIRRRYAAIHIAERTGQVVHGYRIGLNKQLTVFVPVDKKNPTLEQLNHMTEVIDMFTHVRKRLDAKAQDHQAST